MRRNTTAAKASAEMSSKLERFIGFWAGGSIWLGLFVVTNVQRFNNLMM